MKKISYFLIPLILMLNISACTGYKPIFSSSNIQFELADYSLKGNKKIGNQIYSKLYGLSNANKNNPDARSVHISIDVVVIILIGNLLIYRTISSIFPIGFAIIVPIHCSGMYPVEGEGQAIPTCLRL